MGFLTKDDFVSLLNRLISHFPSGEMAFNSYTSFAVWASKVVRCTKSVVGVLKFPGLNDPYELERWNPKLKLIREILLTREPRGCRVSDGRSPLHLISGDERNLVPEGIDRPALPLPGDLAVV